MVMPAVFVWTTFARNSIGSAARIDGSNTGNRRRLTMDSVVPASLMVRVDLDSPRQRDSIAAN